MTDSAFGCAQCTDADAEQAFARALRVPGRLRMVDESHLGVGLRRCDGCGQDYLFLFAETIDWTEGDDPQEFLFIAVTPAEAEGLAGITEDDLVAALDRLPGRTYLSNRVGHGVRRPGTIWRTGQILIPPYD